MNGSCVNAILSRQSWRLHSFLAVGGGSADESVLLYYADHSGVGWSVAGEGGGFARAIDDKGLGGGGYGCFVIDHGVLWGVFYEPHAVGVGKPFGFVVCYDEVAFCVDVAYLEAALVISDAECLVECVFEAAYLSVMGEVEEVVVALGAESPVQGCERLHQDTHEGGEDRLTQESGREQDGEFLIVDFVWGHGGLCF